METRKSNFNRVLLILLTALYLVALGAFSYFNQIVEQGRLPLGTILLNALILSLPLLLICAAVYVLALAWRERKAAGEVSPQMAKFIHWAPRLAAMLIIFFISLFSLDVFEQGESQPRFWWGCSCTTCPPSP